MQEDTPAAWSAGCRDLFGSPAMQAMWARESGVGADEGGERGGLGGPGGERWSER
jgi:hypothetical protein